MDEGYIKYNCQWNKVDPIIFEGFQEINKWRDKLYQLGLIGMHPNKIGFGNISIRIGRLRQFYISGSATGGLAVLNETHYTAVTDFHFETNNLTCQGPIQASSESLTHAAVYLADPEVNAVIHVHHLQSWQTLLNKIPTTALDIAYGTPEMAFEILRLFKETDLKKGRVLVMGGHQEGIVSFGKNMDEAGRVLLEQLRIEELRV
jgi:ribulose-5-phosphate 4-epimerase/fuculose-1-phosphate aldolase